MTSHSVVDGCEESIRERVSGVKAVLIGSRVCSRGWPCGIPFEVGQPSPSIRPRMKKFKFKLRLFAVSTATHKQETRYYGQCFSHLLHFWT